MPTSHRLRTVLAVSVAAAALVATTATVTYAASSAGTSGVRACANAKGTLRLIGSNGKCPKGYPSVTIGKQGRPGATGRSGPGATFIRIATTSATTRTASYLVPGTGLRVEVACNTGTYGVSTLTIVNTDGKARFLARGHTVIGQNGDNPYYYFDSSGSRLPGGNLGIFRLDVDATKNATGGLHLDNSTTWQNQIDSSLMVVRGTTSFSIDYFASQNTTICESQAQIIRNG